MEIKRAGFEVRKRWGWVRRDRREVRMDARRVERLEAFSMIARSIAQMRGETRPEAQAAAVKSEATRHDKFFVLQS